MTNTIQGNDAVLSLYKNDWVVFLCATDIALQIDIDVLQTRGPGDGHWGKNTYQKINYTITLSGVLKMNDTDDESFSGFDILQNIKGFVHLPFRIAYTDDTGNTKSVQGTAMITGLNFGASVGTVVKNDVNLLGDGELMFYDGLIPCDSTIETITVDGQTDEDGIVHVSWTYTGDPYQIKYRIDGVGDYLYSIADTTLDIPGLPVGDHSIELIPVCANGYEGEGMSEDFEVTQNLTCAITTTSITFNAGVTVATIAFSAAPPTFKYRIDDGPWVNRPGTGTSINLVFMEPGDHSIEVVPICANGVSGTGATEDFTIASQPAQSAISYSFTTVATHPLSRLNIYVDGVLQVAVTSTETGSIIAATGSNVKAVLLCADPSGKHTNLIIENTTTSTALYHGINTSPITDQYIFSPDGSSYSITETIS